MTDDIRGAATFGGDPVVLYFHHVGRKIDHYTSLSTSQFRQALEQVLLMADIVSLEDHGPFGRPAFAFTFDDGYSETVDEALPILDEVGVAATWFVNTGTLGGSIRVSNHEHPTLSWEGVRALAAAGQVIGAHGHRHQPWDSLTRDQLEHEVTTQNELFGKNLGWIPRLFAYPFGRFVPALPTEFAHEFSFSTTRVDAAHRNCRPEAIRRVYLPSESPNEWSSLIREWTREWDGGCERRCPHCRTMG